MYSFTLTIHSTIRFVLIALLLWVIVRSLVGWVKNGKFSVLDNKISLALVIATHLQLLMGLISYFYSPFVKFQSSSMKDSILRYWLVEHLLMMIIAVVLITIGRAKMKKAVSDRQKFKTLFIWNVLACVIIVIAILLSGRPFFGMT